MITVIFTSENLTLSHLREVVACVYVYVCYWVLVCWINKVDHISVNIIYYVHHCSMVYKTILHIRYIFFFLCLFRSYEHNLWVNRPITCVLWAIIGDKKMLIHTHTHKHAGDDNGRICSFPVSRTFRFQGYKFHRILLPKLHNIMMLFKIHIHIRNAHTKISALILSDPIPNMIESYRQL